MLYLNVKSSGSVMNVSKIVLGTDYFGTNVKKDEAYAMLNKFIEHGGNCIDTARVYASWIKGGEGASEKLIGDWMYERKLRDKLIISTKGGHFPLGQPHISRLSRECLESDLNESLKALRTDYVDIYWLHRDNLNHPVSDIMNTLADFINKGKVRAIGCSNWTVERIEEANRYAQSNGLYPFAMSQIQWSLATSTPEAHGDNTIICMNDDEYQWYKANKFPVMAYSSQAKGFFTRAAEKGLDGINQKAMDRFCSPENIERLERVKLLSKKNGITVTAAVLGYITCNSVPAMAIVGCKTLSQLEDSLTAADVELSMQEVEWLFKG